MGLRFDWDADKDKLNADKHGLRFEEASAVFNDPLAVIFEDEFHSQEESRELIIGHDSGNRLVLVCFTMRGDAVRIISARLATRRERRDYEGQR